MVKEIERVVSDIICDVKERGDKALCEYSEKFDGAKIVEEDLFLDMSECKKAFDSLPKDLMRALERARDNIFDYHRKQFENIKPLDIKESGYSISENITTVDKVGVYVPGGRFSYPSTVFMTVLPAKASGATDIIVATPLKNLTDVLKAALYIAGVKKVLCVGGAQAIAALAYGAESVEKVDLIVGPGNAYVTEAKKQVFGDVGIDMLAGPSDVMILADKSVSPHWIKEDLSAQLEHDPESEATLVTIYPEVIDSVKELMEQEYKDRANYIKKDKIEDCISYINQKAPEHLELLVTDYDNIVKKIKHAGAIFVGNYTTVALGDYWLGPSHTLPTAGCARFSSGLSVHTFIKRAAIMHTKEEFLKNNAKSITNIAIQEGLIHHATSIKTRTD